MNNFNISIFGNKILSEIISEIKRFSKYQIKYYEDLSFCIKDTKDKNQILVFFASKINMDALNKVKTYDLPILFISDFLEEKNIKMVEMKEKLDMPFTIINFEKKIISLISKNEFKKNSFISLNGYMIDRNERKIKKDNIEVQLSEKEIDFLILFSKNNKKPLSRNFVLTNVWKYSSKTETHTVETHIHRLRKKILEKFGDNNFIKNNNKGYYI